MYKVYMHKHKASGKVYIGCTKKSPERRFERGNGYVKCVRFYAAIQEYGWDSFDHIIVKDGLEKEEAMELEALLVRKYNSTDPKYGYNMRHGGYHNTPCSEVCKHISEAKIGHEVSEETRAKLREYGKKPVLQMDLLGNPLRVFSSLTEAARAVGADKANIYSACSGKNKTCKKYKWAYYLGGDDNEVSEAG